VHFTLKPFPQPDQLFVFRSSPDALLSQYIDHNHVERDPVAAAAAIRLAKRSKSATQFAH